MDTAQNHFQKIWKEKSTKRVLYTQTR